VTLEDRSKSFEISNELRSETTRAVCCDFGRKLAQGLQLRLREREHILTAMKRLNLKLADDLHTKVKVSVALEQTNISEVVRGFLEQYVAKVEKAHEQKRTK
jgi:hypothetical protein